MKKCTLALVCLLICLFLLTACVGASPEVNIDEKEHLIEEKAIVEPNGDINTSRSQARDMERVGKNEQFVQEISLFFFNRIQNSLTAELRRIVSSQPGISFFEIIEALSKGPISPDLEPIIPPQTKLLSASHIEGLATINLSSDFLEAKDLLVARAALVNTLVDIDGIEFVKVLVDGKEFTKSGTQEGETLGVLTRFPTKIEDIIALDNKALVSDEVRTLDWELFFQDREGNLLLSEVRTINVRNMEYVRAIVEELIKGPSSPNIGLYRTIPSGARLLDAEIIKSSDAESKDLLKLRFTEEFSAVLNLDNSALRTTIGSLVLSLTSLSNVGRVSVAYNNTVVEMTGLMEILNKQEGFVKEDFSDILGRRIRVFFSDSNAMHLVPEYRAMNRGDLRIARRILNDLIEGPLYKGNLAIMPLDLSIDNLRVWVDKETAYVDLPANINLNHLGSTGEIMAIYAIVNSLTDTMNTRNIKKVQFLVGGVVNEGIGHLSLREPFVRNLAMISDK